MRTLLIDGDILVYKAGFAAEKTFEFDEDTWASQADLADAKAHFAQFVDDMIERLKTDEIIVALSDDLNWRKELYPDYKAQRKKTRRPILLKPLKAWAIETYRTFIRPTLEADDVLGILATAKTIVEGDKIVCSIDKDLLQIPGKHFNIDTGKKTTITEAEGDHTHLMQTLTGDVVDNYPGCPGIGKVTAEKILSVRETVPAGEDPQEYQRRRAWRAIVEAYQKKGLTAEHALVQARIARICRASDYDFSTKSVRLWTP